MPTPAGSVVRTAWPVVFTLSAKEPASERRARR